MYENKQEQVNEEVSSGTTHTLTHTHAPSPHTTDWICTLLIWMVMCVMYERLNTVLPLKHILIKIKI